MQGTRLTHLPLEPRQLGLKHEHAGLALPEPPTQETMREEVLYRLRGTGAAIQGLGVMAERQGAPGELGELDTTLQALGESIVSTTAEVREEVGRITGQAF